jgi:hypothetical protein
MTRQITWYPPESSGLEPIVLTDRAAGHRVFTGVRGLGPVRRELVTEDVPFFDGTEVYDDVGLPRTVYLPMMVFAADRDGFLERLRALTAALRTRGADGSPVTGQLELQQADGRRRRLRCHYQEGLPDEESIELGGDTNWQRFTLALFAADPYFYDPEPVTLSWDPDDPVTFLSAPMLPPKISPSQVIGDQTLTNAGTEAAYGTWRITGPGNSIILTNITTGQEIELNGTIAAGEVVTIVTEPRLADITLDGVDWWDSLEDGGDLWAIPNGSTELSLTLGGMGSGSRVELEFFKRYESPW